MMFTGFPNVASMAVSVGVGVELASIAELFRSIFS